MISDDIRVRESKGNPARDTLRKMKKEYTYYYFLASVSNATSPAVRTLTATVKKTDAMASAAIALSNYGFHVTQLQELTAEQFNAGDAAPMAYNVTIDRANEAVAALG